MRFILKKMIIFSIMMTTFLCVCNAKTTNKKSSKNIKKGFDITKFVKLTPKSDIMTDLPDIDLEALKDDCNLQIKNTDLICRKKSRNIAKTIMSWCIVLCLSLFFVKLLLSNFYVPFNYDPNFKNKKYKHKYNKL